MIDTIFGGAMHERRLESLANATTGVVTSAKLAVRAIGQGYAQAAEPPPATL